MNSQNRNSLRQSRPNWSTPQWISEATIAEQDRQLS